MPKPPARTAQLPALFVKPAVVFQDAPIAHAIEESDEAEGDVAFEVEGEAEGEVIEESGG